MTFTDREIALENEMAERGQERRRANTARTRALGRESLTPAGHGLIRAAMGRTVAALEDWLKAQGRQKPTNRPAVYAVARELPPKIASLIALRATLDGAGAGDSWQAIVHAIARRLNEERMGRWLAKAHGGTWASLRRRAHAIPERAPARLRRSAKLAAKDKGYAPWTMTERLQLGGLLLHLIEEHAGLIEVESVPGSGRRKRLVVHILPVVAEWIAEASRRDELLEPLYMPMLDEPGDWAQDRAGGYSTGLVARKHLVKNRSKVTRELVAGAEIPAVYGAVNALQRTAWEINPDVLEVAKALWAGGQHTPGLEKAEDDPMPPEPATGKDSTWMRQRFLVRRANLYRTSRRTEAARILWLADRLRSEGHFYFPQQLDFRGRVYPIPQFLQPQGPDLARGILRFGQGSWITEDAPDFWLHGANCLGYDKISIEGRLLRIRAHAKDILAVAQDPLENRWWQGADEPWQFLAWCLEAGPLLETGRTHTRVPCYVDGTNNGLQILSLLLRDAHGGASTNCVPGPRRDVYQDVADEVTRRLKDIDDHTARAWLSWFPNGRMPRAAAKRSVMTLPYGCTPWSSTQYVADWFEEELRLGKASPWGTERYWPHVVDLSRHLWAAIQAVLGRALECMEWLRECARISVAAGVGPVWTSPTGFPVRQSYTNYQVQQVRTKFGERVRWVRSRKAGDRMNSRRHVNAMPPNFVHSLDAAVLCKVVSRFSPNGQNPVSTIHDSFGTTADRIGDLGRLVREAYAEVFSVDLLENLREQLFQNAGSRVDFPQPPERGALDPRSVIQSAYLFS
jgi:DNA-directed RNA polymerase